MEPAIETYLRSVKAVCNRIPEDEMLEFGSRITLLELGKKDLFFQAGKVQKAVGFVVAGLVRSFYVDDNGNEITVGFYAEGDYVTHYHAFLSQKPSSYSSQCLEPTTFACLSLESMNWMYEHSIYFERYGRLIAEEILKRQQARIESFIFQTPESRYLDFVEKRSNLFNRISLSHLSSYLGIERQTLTRIRQRLAVK